MHVRTVNKKNKCVSEKQNHRTITENGNRLQREMYIKMEKEEYREEGAKRSSVEGSFGPLKIQYDMEDEVVIGIEDTEDYMTLNTVAYNLNRLYKLLYESPKETGVKDTKKINMNDMLQSNLDLVYS